VISEVKVFGGVHGSYKEQCLNFDIFHYLSHSQEMEKPPEGAGISGNEQSGSKIDGPEARFGASDYL
jgi:hypothetical protein